MKKFSFNTRKLKYGSASAIYLALFLVLVIVLNIFAQFLTDRFSLKIDMTEAGQYSLSEETKTMLSELETDINIYILSTSADMEKNALSKNVLETIQRYNSASGGKVKYEYIDPNKNPQFFEKHTKARNADARALVIEGPERYTVVNTSQFAYYLSNSDGESKKNKVYYQSEEKLSSAILHVSSAEVSAAGIVKGHGEEDEKDKTVSDALSDIFEGNNFSTEEVDLLKGVPEHINNLVICAPRTDFTPDEIVELEKYLSRNGSNVYLFWDMAVPTLPVLERFLAEWGIAFEPYLVCDEKNAYGATQSFALASVVPENTVVDEKTQGELFAISPYSRPIKLLWSEKSYMRTVSLLSSYDTSYAKLISKDNLLKTLAKESGDISGPFTVAAMGEKALGNSGNEGYSRIVVFGSGSFAANGIAGVSRAYNDEFLSEIVSYANPGTLTMSIMPKVVSTYDLNITQASVDVLFWVLVIIVPLIIVALGVLVFIRRKNK